MKKFTATDQRRNGLSRALYEELRTRIADGTYAVGAALPSTRALAAERALSRATVTLVYEQLAVDGFIETRAGAASRVAAGAVANYSQRKQKNRSVSTQPSFGRLSLVGERIATFPVRQVSAAKAGEVDFVYGPLAGSDFPTLAWMKASQSGSHAFCFCRRNGVGGCLTSDCPLGAICSYSCTCSCRTGDNRNAPRP